MKMSIRLSISVVIVSESTGSRLIFSTAGLLRVGLRCS
jgi:hypothetical protein